MQLMSWDDFVAYTKADSNDCWIWQLSTKPDGYGRITRNHKGYLAHRISMHLTTGFDLDNKSPVCHKCDNPSCVNPDHLYVGTMLQNMHDMFRRGRAVRASKLNAQEVAEVKHLYDYGFRRTWIGDAYGVGLNAIDNILFRKPQAGIAMRKVGTWK